MPKTLENTQDKIQEICDALKKETLDPAHEEAKRILSQAKDQADKIIHEAHAKAEDILGEGLKKIEKERNVFQSALGQGAKQALEALRQSVEHELFEPTLAELVEKEASNPDFISSLIKNLVNAVEKEGLHTDLEVWVSKNVDSEAVSKKLGKTALNRLKGKSLQLSSISGGAEIKLEDKKVTIDMSDEVLKKLLANYLRKDFRELIFKL